MRSEYRFSLLDDSFQKDLSLPARLDTVLREIFPLLSRKKIAVINDNNKLFVNDRPARPGDMLYGREEIFFEGQVEELLPSSGRPALSDIGVLPELNIIYEDEHIIAVNKPRGMHSVLQRHSDPLTLADLLADYEPKLITAGRNPGESGLVQRLDYWTSGILLACKERKDWEILHQQFVSKQVEKTYIAEIDKNISDLPTRHKSFVFEIYKSLPESTLVRITLKDGSRHIVRKTFSDLGYPLLGDTEYDSPETAREGFFLHAETICFLNFNKRKLVLNAPMEIQS
jgi:23S rRNA pseudouridine1911/1915/1917 synthase